MSDYSDFTYLDVSVDQKVAVVTLNGPHEGNALTFEGHVEMCRIYPRLQADENVRAVVLTGANGAFSVGATPELMAATSGEDPVFTARMMSDVRELVVAGVSFEKPVVTALNGPAVGGPMAFALTGDIVIAERQAVISDMHIMFGVTPGDGNVLFWPAAMGLYRAKRYLLTGDPMSAEEAHRFGLVAEVVDEGASLARAKEFAHKLTRMSPVAMGHAKRSLNQWLRLAMPAFDLSWAGEMMTVSLPPEGPGLDMLKAPHELLATSN